MNEKVIKYDVDGYDEVTEALRDLVNQYPALEEWDEIAFSVLGEDSGKAMYPVSGAIIQTSKVSITGKVTEICLYPFYVIYKAGGLSENRKAKVKEWLDNLGKWLEKKPVKINGSIYHISEYPALTESRTFLGIERQTPAYLDTVNENKSENWAIYISARYEHVYYKNNQAT